MKRNMLTKFTTTLTACTAAFSVLITGNPGLLTGAQSTDLAERISEETEIWGSHIICSDVFMEIDDPTILPEAKRESFEAIRVEDCMWGLVFRVNGALPEKVGNYNIHFFQEYFPYDKNKQDSFKADSAGCFVASYAYYEGFLENMFEVLPWYKEEPADIRFTEGNAIELSDTDSVVILMLGYPSDIQSNHTYKEYFLEVEKAFSACEQFSYVGEARRIEQTFYINDGLEIVCIDADAAKELRDSDLLASYTVKHIVQSNPCMISLPELLTDEARELRELVRQDERVLSAQIDYCDEPYGAVICGIYSSDRAPTVTTEATTSTAQNTETTTETTVFADYTDVTPTEETTLFAGYSDITTTTISTEYTNTSTLNENHDSNLPQTGQNSMTNLLVAFGAFLLIGTGAGAVYSSGILRRKEDEK